MATSEQELVRRVADVAYELHVGGSAVFPSVRLAQAILETGGQIPSWNNVFGIKVGTGTANPYWDGRYVNRTTREVIDGQLHENVMAQWRYYTSVENSVRDHELFLQRPRYEVVRAALTPLAQCEALYAAGYATDPLYAEKLWRVITSRGLLQHDTEAALLKQQIEDRLARLSAGLSQLSDRTGEQEQLKQIASVPEWAQSAVSQAVAIGLIDTPAGGSYDFYRIITVLWRQQLL